ncbi:hypothetical protein DSM106972_021540 [Dulcicalothrix desertica PCC 7102]|uniref:Uncharacterized protein n=1 Tax=Dulcicalothrix desertica PCC 7102 TaxID=232991 RepID=A0A3S1CRE1_9CYAN|nr:hypothetical protein [Dulcicalothrix desertica]RUT07894.1 hypothetical protein DSM106972_021540 [Dulcicalothrix desertica PCC 7102]TWH39415.1 hypothetical protein CAL7102_08646 [Dulcicalothrix desertica PCC 7102]
MPAIKLIFPLFLTAMIALPASIANAGELDIQTSNVQMELDEDGDIYIRTIRTAPVPRVIVNPAVNQNIYRNRQMRVFRSNNKMKCRNVTQRRNSRRGGNQIYTSNTTTVCS